MVAEAEISQYFFRYQQLTMIGILSAESKSEVKVHARIL